MAVPHRLVQHHLAALGDVQHGAAEVVRVHGVFVQICCLAQQRGAIVSDDLNGKRREKRGKEGASVQSHPDILNGDGSHSARGRGFESPSGRANTT